MILMWFRTKMRGAAADREAAPDLSASGAISLVLCSLEGLALLLLAHLLVLLLLLLLLSHPILKTRVRRPREAARMGAPFCSFGSPEGRSLVWGCLRSPLV